MKLTILKDTENNPRIFSWLGKIERDLFNNWLDENKLDLPDDLKEFLLNTGGGTAFESEEFLCPLNTPDYESDFLKFNEWHQDKGLSKNHTIFSSGIFLSAIRISDKKYVLLDKKTYSEIEEFKSFDEWYSNTIREEFAERSGLAKYVCYKHSYLKK